MKEVEMSKKLFWQIVLLMAIGVFILYAAKCVAFNCHAMAKKMCPVSSQQMK